MMSTKSDKSDEKVLVKPAAMNIIYDINRTDPLIYLITVSKNQLFYKKLKVDHAFTRTERRSRRPKEINEWVAHAEKNVKQKKKQKETKKRQINQDDDMDDAFGSDQEVPKTD